MKYLYTLYLITACIVSHGQSITGKWETFDDETKVIIEIFKKDNSFFAKIVDSYVSDKNTVCETCVGKNKGKPIIGLIIIENIKKDGDTFNGGTIMDPENGKTYSCYLELINKNTLKVRGYLGFSLFGRTQYWIRKE